MSFFFFFSSRRRHTRWTGDWSSDVCSSDLKKAPGAFPETASTGENTSTATNGTTTTSPFSDPLMRWSSLDNIVEPHQDYQVVQEVSPTLGTWHSNGTPEPDRWNPVSQDADASSVKPEPELWASLPTLQEVNENQT